MGTMQVGLQLYTVRDELARDYAGTIRRVGEIGYTAVEMAGYGGMAAPQLKALLDESGLRAASTHVGLTALQENLDAEIEYSLAIGCAYLVLPSLPQDLRNAAALRELAPRLTQIGRRCKEYGLAFAYHDHDWEFGTAEGHYLLDILLDHSDPGAVSLELDLYWAAFAGADPVAYLQRRADRVRLLHLKDLGADRRYTEVGEGSLDFAAIFAAADQAGVPWGIVELDNPTGPSLESARLSLQNLRRMGRV